MINGNLDLLECLREEPCEAIGTKAFADELLWRFRSEGDELIFEVSTLGGDYQELGRSTVLNPRGSRHLQRAIGTAPDSSASISLLRGAVIAGADSRVALVVAVAAGASS